MYNNCLKYNEKMFLIGFAANCKLPQSYVDFTEMLQGIKSKFIPVTGCGGL
jgi:hypothetical protein